MNDLSEVPYISLATFRRDGRKVATPVWAAPHCGALLVFSDPNAGKVKRLRNSSQAEIAHCDVRGTLLGDWQEATAELVNDPAIVADAHAAFLVKYGWQARALNLVSRLGGRLAGRQYIRVTPLSTNR